ncbi:MAG: glutamyl-tRNA reductase [Bacteroidota bacterium]
MTLHALGLNHDHAPTAVREAFVLTDEALERFYAAWPRSKDAEALILTTCNRTEAIVFGSDDDRRAVIETLEHVTGAAWPASQAFSFQDEEAVRHVLGVAAGLRSLVLGDAQILHQVKEAYRCAVEHETVGSVLHRLMHVAFQVAKQVRTETGLAQGAASVSSRAVAAARELADGGSLDGQRVLLIGAGHMGMAALNALATYDLEHLAISNRSDERAVAAALKYGGRVLAWEQRHQAMRDADIVLVASGALEPVIRAEHVPHREADRPALVIDIAVPRNVERAVDALPGYTVLDLDQLNQHVEATAAARRRAVPAAEAIVEDGLAEYVTWFFHQQALQPTIQAIRATFDAIRHQEIERHAHRIPEVARDDVERLTESIMQKLLAVPVVRLKATDPESLDFVRGIKALATIFSQPEYALDPVMRAIPLPKQKGEPVLRAAPPAQAPPNTPGPPPACPFGHDSHESSPSDPRSLDAHRNARK